MNISLTPELERFVAQKVEEGHYASQSEVLRAGLRLLAERERIVATRIRRGEADLPAAAHVEVDGGRAALPPELWAHFPEHRGSGLSLDRDRESVIDRLLRVTDLRAAQWLRERVPRHELRAHLFRAAGEGMDERAVRFWALLLDVPAPRVDEGGGAATQPALH